MFTTTKMAIATSLLLVGLGTAACGGDEAEVVTGSDAPKDASVEKFCEAMEGFGDQKDDTPVAEVAPKLQDTGTPADIPADARRAFEFLIDNAQKLDELKDEIDSQEGFTEAFSAQAAQDLIALYTYYGQTCVTQ